MNVSVTFHQVDKSDALESFIKGKTNKLGKFLANTQNVRWVVEFKNRVFTPVLNFTKNGKSFSVHAKSDNAFHAVNDAVKHAKRMLVEQKVKRTR